ncbi:BrnA antitoxin family protein [Aestuariivita boseongensis]|uniref:BrnA antitoxin family protein n=1 Tax=Aestuariivita boseongensis TaxID=1470562 RepID=UPI000681908E|nr:BrnA antitoxin family protein [Aestuariivita boseongensis]
MDYLHPLEPAKTRVTLRLDADMVRWFRKMGPGYQARMNLILRIYWTALLSGNNHSRFQDDTLLRFHAAAREMLAQHSTLMKEARNSQL